MIEIFAGSICILIILFWFWSRNHTANIGAPYEGMDPAVVERIMKMARVGKNDVFYDLGSGDGRVIIAAAMREATAVGIEIDKLRYLYSVFWIKLLGLSKQAKIINKNIFDVNLKNASVVCTYLLPETHEKLKEKLKKELKKGAKIIAVGFEYKNWKPVETDPRGGNYGPIFLYKNNIFKKS